MHLLQSTLAALSEPTVQPDLATCMQSYDAANSNFNHDFFTITLDKHPEVSDFIKKLLDSLGVSPEQQSRYLHQKLTVHECLVEINELANRDYLTDFIDILSKRKKARWINVVLGSVLGGVLGTIPFFQFGLTALQQVVSVAFMASCGGLMYSVAAAIYTAYTVYESPERSSSMYQDFVDNLFIFAKKMLTISAYSVMLIAAVTTPAVLILFVVADAILVMKEIATLAYIYLYENPGINPKSSMAEQHTQARELTDYEKRKYAAWVNIVSAILMTGIVAAWCFAPGGIFLIVGALLAIGGVYFTTNYLIKQNEKKMDEVLKLRFAAIEQGNRPSIDASSNAKMQASLTSLGPRPELCHTASQEPVKDERASSRGLVEYSLFSRDPTDHIEANETHQTPRSPRGKI